MTSKAEVTCLNKKIIDWYSCIISSSIEQANELKTEITREITKQKEHLNDKTLAFYSLVEYRHHIFQNGFDKSQALPSVKDIDTLDTYMKYLYYFFGAQHEYAQERYRSAIRMFRKAERLLEHVSDETEEAEFYQHIGASYYRIDEYLVASSYLEQAEFLFRKLGYNERMAETQMVFGSMYSEIGDYMKGDRMLEEALATVDHAPKFKAMILRALGLSAFRQGNYVQAQKHFDKALTEPSHVEGLVGAKTMYNLAYTLFKLEMDSEAKTYLQTAKEKAMFYHSFEFNLKCDYLKGLYVEKDYEMVRSAIDGLSELGLDYEVRELAKSLSDTFKEIKDYEKAFEYLEIAYKHGIFKNTMGVEEH